MVEPVTVEPNLFVNMMEFILVVVFIVVPAIVIISSLGKWGVIIIILGVIAVILIIELVIQPNPELNDAAITLMNWLLQKLCMAECGQ